MKLLVFAHIPPPHHGQSYMVKLMLDGLGGDCRQAGAGLAHPLGIECYHVDARFSRGLEDVGEFRGTKILLVFWYSLLAIWYRFRYGVTNIYYVPAPGKRVAVYRDWLAMFLCRPFFKRTILHWHAAGLSRWLETSGTTLTRDITYRLMRDADVSIILSDFNRRDAEKLTAKQITIVKIGIPDPCAAEAAALIASRSARAQARREILAGRPSPVAGAETVNVLFLALCTREKGVFEAVAGVALANRKMAETGQRLRFRLTIIGGKASLAEEAELQEFIAAQKQEGLIERLGFVPAERKQRALHEADLFCFPTYYLAENQPGNLIEAMAFGLPLVTTRWRSIPEMLPPGYPGLVEPKAPDQVAEALVKLVGEDLAGSLRELFLQRFTLEKHLAAMAAAIRGEGAVN